MTCQASGQPAPARPTPQDPRTHAACAQVRLLWHELSFSRLLATRCCRAAIYHLSQAPPSECPVWLWSLGACVGSRPRLHYRLLTLCPAAY